MLTLFMFAMVLFLAWRAFVYYNDERVVACILAMLGCAFFAFGIYVDYHRWSSTNPPANSSSARSTEEETVEQNAEDSDFDVEDLTLGQKLNLCGKKSYELGVDRAPRIEPDDQHKVTEFIKGGGCERAYEEFESDSTQESDGAEETEFGEPTANSNEPIIN